MAKVVLQRKTALGKEKILPKTDWSVVENKPLTFAPTAHNHNASNINAGTLAIARGGTNIGTYAKGDILYASAENVLSRLAAGTNGYVLKLASGIPTWAADSQGVTSVALATGTNNGTLKLTVNGTATDNIAVKGLGTAAYTASTNYAVSNHGHGDITATGYIGTATNKVLVTTTGGKITTTSGTAGQYLKHDGSWGTPPNDNTDTKNTAGTTNLSNTLLFLAGATGQSANPQTYSNNKVYIGTDNCLYSNSKKVATADELKSPNMILIATGSSGTEFSGSRTITTGTFTRSNYNRIVIQALVYSSYSDYEYIKEYTLFDGVNYGDYSGGMIDTIYNHHLDEYSALEFYLASNRVYFNWNNFGNDENHVTLNVFGIAK